MSVNKETLGKFSAQVMIVIQEALVTWVLMDALRQKRQLEATALGTQTEFNPVNQITAPRNVYCSPHDEEVRRVEERAHGCYQ